MAMPTCATIMPTIARGISRAESAARWLAAHAAYGRAQPGRPGRSRPGRDDPERHQQPDRADDADAALGPGDDERRDHRASCRPLQPCGEIGQLAVLPARHRTDAHQEDERREQRHEHGVEVRRPDRDLAEVHGIEGQRVERAEQHSSAGDDEQHVVGQQQRLCARAGSKRAPNADAGRAPGVERKRRADDDDQEDEDEEAAARVASRNACTDESTPERTRKVPRAARSREGEDGQQHRPVL